MSASKTMQKHSLPRVQNTVQDTVQDTVEDTVQGTVEDARLC